MAPLARIDVRTQEQLRARLAGAHPTVQVAARLAAAHAARTRG